MTFPARPATSGEDGAALLLVLILTTVVGVMATGLAALAFATSKQSRALYDRQRIETALDNAIALALDDVASGAPESLLGPIRIRPCGATPREVLRLPDAAGPGSAITAVVNCRATGDPGVSPVSLRMVATAFLDQFCDPPVDGPSASVALLRVVATRTGPPAVGTVVLDSRESLEFDPDEMLSVPKCQPLGSDS